MGMTSTTCRAILFSILTACAADTADDGDDEVDDNAEALAAEAAIGGHAFGLGVDAPKAVASPLFATLKSGWIEGDARLSTARIVYYLDPTLDNESKLRVWVDGVKAGGLQPVVAVSVLHGVSRTDYRARFDRLLHDFPDVAYWGAVNEPDLEISGSSEERADAAAVFYADAYRVLRRCQNAGRCKGSVLLVAGEFAYQGGNPASSVAFWKKYADALKKQVKSAEHPNAPIHRFPRIWSFHPYTDTTSGKADGTHRFDAFLAGVEKDENLPNKHLRAWLTETGGILHHGDTCTTSVGNINGKPQAQYDGAKATFGLQKDTRVDRVYWWHFQQIIGHPWDSAMVDGEGVPRGSFCALTRQPLAACKGDPWATQCKP
jgi:hypothetical protein